MGTFNNISKAISKAKDKFVSFFRTNKAQMRKAEVRAEIKSEEIALTKSLKPNRTVSSISFRKRKHRQKSNDGEQIQITDLNQRTIRPFGTFRAIRWAWYLPSQAHTRVSKG